MSYTMICNLVKFAGQMIKLFLDFLKLFIDISMLEPQTLPSSFAMSV